MVALILPLKYIMIQITILPIILVSVGIALRIRSRHDLSRLSFSPDADQLCVDIITIPFYAALGVTLLMYQWYSAPILLLTLFISYILFDKNLK
jgi:hypothetical protein